MTTKLALEDFRTRGLDFLAFFLKLGTRRTTSDVKYTKATLLMFNLRSLRQKSRLSGGQINYREEEKRILDSILGRDVYDNRIRPSGLNGTGKDHNQTHTLKNHKVLAGTHCYKLVELVHKGSKVQVLSDLKIEMI